MPPSLNDIDHIHVYVQDRVAAEAWYARVLGMLRVEQLATWAADGGPLTIGNPSATVHLALFERPAQACRSTIAFAVGGQELLAWQEHLSTQLPTTPRLEDHQMSYSLYFSDPDGNPYEITSYDYDLVTQLIKK